MNYLAELNAFHDYLLANQLSTSEIVLWHALMHINNKTMWKTEFTASNLILQQLTGLSRSTLADAKNKLKQRGLLSYKPGKPRQAGTFCMVSLLEESELVRLLDEFPDELSDESRTSSRTNPGRVPGTLININKDINKNKEKEKINKKKNAEGFEEFWQAYPKKAAKTNAQKAFEKLKPTPEFLAEILSALNRQKQSDAWQQENGKYIPHPATWLNGRRWEDEETNVRSFGSENKGAEKAAAPPGGEFEGILY